MANLRTLVNSHQLGRMLQLKGCLLHYYEDGVGEPLLLLHGLGLSLYTYGQVIEPLAQSLRVIAVDMPGCGYSEVSGAMGVSTQEWARLLGEAMDALALDRVAICAHAQSAAAALCVAQQMPQRVAALMLVSPGSITRQYPLYMRVLTRPRLGEIAISNLYHPRYVDHFLRWSYFDETSVDRYRLRQTALPFENRRTRANLHRIACAYDDSSALAALDTVRCPVLLLRGHDDAAHRADTLEPYLLHIRDVRLKELHNCGFLPQEEKPRDFSAAVEAFLSEVYADTRMDAADNPLSGDLLQ